MALVKAKPTSPGRRFVVEVKNQDLHKGKPHSALVEKKIQTGGRNNYGRVTTRHRGGGHKQRYRIIDFKRNKDGVPAKVTRIEYDPNRSAHIALLTYADGERSYIIAAKGLNAGSEVISIKTMLEMVCTVFTPNNPVEQIDGEDATNQVITSSSELPKSRKFVDALIDIRKDASI